MGSASLNRSGKSTVDSAPAAQPALDGLVLLDKPQGITSFQCLGRIKRVLGTRRVGHVGTLDPFASGLLGAVAGRATRLAGLLSGLDKCYLATIRFGRETDTLDPEGAVVDQAPIPELDAIRRVLPALTGRLRQRPPAFSAIRIAGRRSYTMARRGEAPVLPLREVTVTAAEPIDWQPPDLTVKLTCSAGTYVRSWARDLGAAAASCAYVVQLRRLSIGPFSIGNSVAPCDFVRDHLQPPAAFLCRLPGVSTVRVKPRYRRSVVHGQPVAGHFFASDPDADADHCAVLDDDDCLLAVLRRRSARGSARPASVVKHAPDGPDGPAASSGWSYAGVFCDH